MTRSLTEIADLHAIRALDLVPFLYFTSRLLGLSNSQVQPFEKYLCQIVTVTAVDIYFHLWVASSSISAFPVNKLEAWKIGCLKVPEFKRDYQDSLQRHNQGCSTIYWQYIVNLLTINKSTISFLLYNKLHWYCSIILYNKIEVASM